MKTEKRKRVVAFDSWTGGAWNIERLVDAFDKKGMELLLIHVGSWGHDRNRQKEERIGKLLVRDISYYSSNSFCDVLRIEKPVAVLFLSTRAFLHRAFNRYCLLLGIPTLHLYHGLVGVQADSAHAINPWNQTVLVVNRFCKAIGRVWPIYSRSLWSTGASVSEWFRFVGDVWRQILGKSNVGPAARDATATACCVYTNADTMHAVTNYRIPLGAVTAVGNPDLISFGIRRSDLGACMTLDRQSPKDIVYIATGLAEAGFVFNGYNDFVQHLTRTKEILAEMNFNLVVKLHPVYERSKVPESLTRKGVELCSNDNFVYRLKQCTAVIVEPSSAAIIPALLGLPLLLACYGKLSLQRYGDVLTGYPRARNINSIHLLPRLLGEIKTSVEPQAVWSWIRNNSGPMPAEEMPHRVANVVKLLIADE